jgi:hypothetical protein
MPADDPLDAILRHLAQDEDEAVRLWAAALLEAEVAGAPAVPVNQS